MTRTSKEIWLEDGLRLMAQSGVDNVKIDVLCEGLKMTKGSFYHHFQNRQDYLESLLAHWEEQYTSQFIDYSQKGKTPLEKIERLNERVMSVQQTPEVAIRAWALHDKLAREVIERVDKRRVEYVAQLHMELGSNSEQAFVIARAIYSIIIGAQYMLPAMKAKDLREIFNLFREIYLFTNPEE